MEIFGFANIDFKGTEQEVEMFKKLLVLMDKDEDYKDDEDYELPINWFEISKNALLGTLVGNDCPDGDLELAPQLFAALFPAASFSLELRYEISCGGGEDILFADYDGETLSVRRCNTEEDIENLDEDLQTQYEDGELDLVDLEEALLDVNGIEEMQPARNHEYEKSFYDGEDLWVYLNGNE